jgi:hypothetical protein
VSHEEDLQTTIYRAHIAQGFSEDHAQEVVRLTMATMAAVSNIFIDIEGVASCLEVRVASVVCGSQLVISKLMEVLEAANIAADGTPYQFDGSIH